ncbi:NADH dehydrogenase FAD-containing subunit [Fontibacillus solani]|uniref:NADH dehydrogenase FAD-containing subunit n=1 Tax=Fontibacillus solani TaxID=1572857 RepID=A0A7W3XTR5_9BACL|nr:NADH dehydrogenase FAD-containing subunit [Fontibacillus solani]
MRAMPRVVVLGGGYSGVATAKKLQKELHFNEAYITLLNCHDYHYFTTHPHMNGIGTDSIEHTRVAISELIDEFKIDLITSNVREIRLFDKKVVLQDGILSYD